MLAAEIEHLLSFRKKILRHPFNSVNHKLANSLLALFTKQVATQLESFVLQLGTYFLLSKIRCYFVTNLLLI